jgi:glycine cleavage system aminomethyltransferase T/glycine/D-amino acid oxidase-like deaminating enzyme
MSDRALPKHARVVVVGGGVIGTSVAYHLAQMGCSDVVLLERDRLTSGTTWHAAGLVVTFGSTSETSTEMRKYTRDLYARLEAETGLATGFRPIGFIECAADDDRLEEYRRVAAFNRFCGVDVHEISPREIQDLFPLARVDDLLCGFYVKEDGQANPVDVTMALAKGARMKGVAIHEHVSVTGVTEVSGPFGRRVTGVETTHGTIEAEIVVNCAGMWARQLAARSGVVVPLQAAEHYYVLTEGRVSSLATPSETKGRAPWPILEDPASYGYVREEGTGLLVGLFEPVCAPWRVEGVPDDFSFDEIKPDWDRMGPYIEKAMSRVPATLEAGIKKLFCGPESFTPDLQPCVGEAPELQGYFVAAGLNSIGILTGGGLGRVLAHWILTGSPDVDVTGFNVDRLHAWQATPDYRRVRTVESLGMVYQCHYPTRSMQTARGAKRSAIHDRLAARGAWFRDVSGWEGADWYAGDGKPNPNPGPLSWRRPSWFDSWAAEHRAAREGVILMDMSFMAKFLVQGRDAGRLLDWISGGRVNGEPKRVTYTQWLDEAGKLQADLTVTKLASDRFMVVASDTAHRHAETWMRRHFPADDHVFITDVTSGWAQINVQGPRSRELLQAVTTANMSNEAFAFRDAREIEIGYARVLCLRITYLGELGYEIYVPTEQAAHVYERLVEAGETFGLRHAGLKALASLRMEKAYRDYGHDIDNTDNILEAGLGFAVDLDKAGGFLGKDAVLAKKRAGPLTRRLVQILIRDPEPMMFHAEIVLRDGQPVGYIRAASYGHTLGGAVGLALVERKDGGPVDGAYLSSGVWEVDIAGTRYPATASLRPLYDPTSERVKS